jgi:hypothetical protein
LPVLKTPKLELLFPEPKVKEKRGGARKRGSFLIKVHTLKLYSLKSKNSVKKRIGELLHLAGRGSFF